MKGYTLIEILVSLVIIGILFTVGYVGFRDFSRRQALAGEVKQIQGDLSLTQGYALAGQKPTDAKCTGANSLIGYNFDVVSATSYQIEAVCSGGTLSSPAEKTVSLSSLTITNSVNPILFKVLGSGTNIPAGEVAEIKLTQTGTGSVATVTVGAGGEIR